MQEAPPLPFEETLTNELFSPLPDLVAASQDEPIGFPVDSLPPVIADMVSMVSASLQVPESLSAICALGAASACLGKGIVVMSQPHQSTPGNLFIIGMAESGSGKSQTLHHFVAPLRAVEAEQRQKFVKDVKPLLLAEKELLEHSPGKTFKSNADASLLAENMRRIQEIDDKLVLPQFLCDDVTSEKLARILQDQGECVFSCSSEARNAIKNLCGRYLKSGADTDEGVYLQGYSGERVVVNRVAGNDVLLEKPNISLLWLVQPDKFREMLGNVSLTESGFMPRCLIVHTNAKRRPRTGHEPAFDSRVALAYAQKIDALFRAYRLNASAEPRVVTPEAAAAEALRLFHNSTIDSIYADVTSYAARWEENAWRIALVLHVFKHGKAADREPLTHETAKSAITIQKFFIEEQLRLLYAGRHEKREKKKAALLCVITKKFVQSKKPVPRRTVLQHANMDRDTAAPLLSELIDDGAIEQFPTKPNHGPSYIAYAPKPN